ncbi:MAG: hypothetical protein JSS99_10545 [Actinobacteria bacterium]|nr:hypothetical protein [Actinomycetota bacterium]
MRRSLLSLVLVSALALAAPTASALTISHFQAYDAGDHITFKYRVCTPRTHHVRDLLAIAPVGTRHWTRFYSVRTFEAGCHPWVWTISDNLRDGMWAGLIQIGFNPMLDRTRPYRFPVFG